MKGLQRWKYKPPSLFRIMLKWALAGKTEGLASQPYWPNYRRFLIIMNSFNLFMEILTLQNLGYRNAWLSLFAASSLLILNTMPEEYRLQTIIKTSPILLHRKTPGKIYFYRLRFSTLRVIG